jgi:cold-inducible RNA-binding protein
MLETRLYVGNLDYSVDDAKLYELFSSFGQVNSAQVVVDRESGQAKGFGFVEMATEDDARRGIEQGNGLEHDGRVLSVNEARPKDGGRPGETGPRTRWLSRIMERGADGDGYRVEKDGYVTASRKRRPGHKRSRGHR